jgi:deoxyribodipyrimidine photo-lyase
MAAGEPGPVTTIVWLRSDLRLADNPALAAAAARGPVMPVYVWAPDEEGDWPPGAASQWWLHHSPAALDTALRRHRSRLVIRRGPALQTLRDVAAEVGADAVVWNRRYEPAAVDRDSTVKRELPSCRSFGASMLREPRTLATGAWRASPAEPSARSELRGLSTV